MLIHLFSGDDRGLSVNILVSYDINTEDKAGQRRLRRIAKICLNYGQRVQNSVYECHINSAELLQLKEEILAVYNEDKDSIRIYKLGKNYERSVLHYGIKDTFKPDSPLIL